MDQLTTDQRRAIAVQLGHGLVKIEPSTSGRRYQLECSCGWGAPTVNGQPTVTRTSEVEAARTAVWHVKSAVDRYLAERRRSGLGVALGVSQDQVGAGSVGSLQVS